ncbi:threonine-phosphate decarboxylase [Phormidium tenue FACHB-886]|nr:threonine-phosphate decarboxylase [Phormidium tenue FACHB-886]
MTSQPIHGGNLAWAAALAGCSPRELLDFSASINPLGVPPKVIAAIQAHLVDLPHYPDPGSHWLRQAIGRFHGVPPDWILPGNGSAELLTWACRELAALEAVYLITPAFSDYLRALKAFGAEVKRCPLQIELALRHSAEMNNLPLPMPLHACGLLLNNPHNPTGVLFRAEAIAPLLDQVELLVVDEAFMDFLMPDQQQSLIDRLADYPNLVILRSLTKFYSLAGLRIGYAIAHPERLQRWQQWRDPWSVNVLAEAAAIACLQEQSFQQQTWNWLAAARSHLFEGLAALPGLQPLPSAANYLLVRCDISSVVLQRELLQQSRILIRDCVSFPELGDRFFRVAVRTIEENQQLLAGLQQILGRR